MEMLIQVKGGWGRTQVKVKVQELHTHNDVVIAIHRSLGHYDMWTASDLLTGMAITSSISNKFVLAKAKKLIDKHNKKYKGHQMHSLKQLYNCGPSVNFKLLERIERKCIAKGFSSVETINIVGQFADEIHIK